MGADDTSGIMMRYVIVKVFPYTKMFVRELIYFFFFFIGLLNVPTHIHSDYT